MKTRKAEYTLENSEMIPIDLINEILLRLPAKSIARFRCVSKSWASIPRREYFTELFITRSRARPQLLLSCEEYEELFLFSVPQVQSQDVLTANYHMRLPCTHYSKSLGSLDGLFCYQHVPSNSNNAELVICNPSTGQFLTLPDIKTRWVHSFLGFDPIDKQFKLLSKTTRDYNTGEVHQVLTLGTHNISWRMIECSISQYFHPSDGICINGVIYYVAMVSVSHVTGIVCFDVRSEKFSFINKAEEMLLSIYKSTLVNHKEKLGATNPVDAGETMCFELWVVVDAEKHEWSKLFSVSPPSLLVAKEAEFYFVELNGRDVIVWSPCYISKPLCFYVYYYSIESNTFRRVEIQGMDKIKDYRVRVSINHVVDVKPLQ